MDAKYITGLLRNQSVKYLLIQCSDKVTRNSSQFFTPFHDLMMFSIKLKENWLGIEAMRSFATEKCCKMTKFLIKIQKISIFLKDSKLIKLF